ncbi:MAG TPA: hypothetical protein VLV29_08450 [Steroidobacteraceae bacterium]|nr:hypothetical protein [Steroidobacteraceae bacterium]
MTPQALHGLTTAAIVVLIVWRLYARIRRVIGRQRLHPRRPWITLTVLPLILVLLSVSSGARPHLEVPLWGGVLLGTALGVLGLRLTRFEATGAGLLYTPSAHLGIALSTLLVCRIAYRFVTGAFPGAGATGFAAPALTPLTLLLVGTLAGYYCTYALGLLRWQARVRRESQPVVSEPQRS